MSNYRLSCFFFRSGDLLVYEFDGFEEMIKAAIVCYESGHCEVKIFCGDTCCILDEFTYKLFKRDFI